MRHTEPTRPLDQVLDELADMTDPELDSSNISQELLQSDPAGKQDENNNETFTPVTSDGAVVKRIITPGLGTETPEQGDQVQVLYKGALTDGSVFDENQNAYAPFKFKLFSGAVIKGWDFAVQSMFKGETAKFVLKPHMAYGASGAGPQIPPHSTLVFEITLLRWKRGNALTEENDVLFSKLNSVAPKFKLPKETAEITVSYYGRYFTAQDDENMSVGWNSKVENTKESGTLFDSSERFVFGVGPFVKEPLVSEKKPPSPFFADAVARLKKGESGVLRLLTPERFRHLPGVPSDATEVQFTIVLLDFADIRMESDKKVMRKTLSTGTSGFQKAKEGSWVDVLLSGETADGATKFLKMSEEPVRHLVGQGDMPEAVENIIMNMKKGERCLLLAPNDFGYGKRLTRELDVPPDVDLVFDVTLVDFQPGKDPANMTFAEKLQLSTKLRDHGNRLFSDGKYRMAQRKYEKLINACGGHEEDSDVPRDFSPADLEMGGLREEFGALLMKGTANLAMVEIKLGLFDDSLRHLNRVLQRHPNDVKAHFRIALAYSGKQDYDTALSWISKGQALDPESQDLARLRRDVGQKERVSREKERKVYQKMFGAGEE